MKRTKETILAGFITPEEKAKCFREACKELDIPYKQFAFERSYIIDNKYQPMSIMENVYIVNIEEGTMINLAVTTSDVNTTQILKTKNLIVFDKTDKTYNALVNPTIKYSSFYEPDNVSIKVEYKITADLKIEFDSLDDAYNLILHHIFDDVYVDALLDLAYSIKDYNKSEDY